MSTSLTPTLTIIEERSATVAITVPALKEPAPVTTSPSSTVRRITTPSMGEVMCSACEVSGSMGMPEASSNEAFSRAVSSVSRAAL